MIPDDVVERVRESADIVQIIGEHVTLKRTGTDWRGPCPFHQGTHRNFSVSPKKGIYYCFVCHEGGDVFSFLQKRLGIDWPSAVREVAQRVGIEVPDNARREGPDPRDPFWEANAAASEFFQRMLWEDDGARAAREYLNTRRISRGLAERFELGYAPRDTAVLREHLNAVGFDDARLLEAGLLVKGDEDREARPRFRGRLIFPIYELGGKCVGFGGRLLGPGEPKYLNSPESPVFSKGKMLYGLNWARTAIRRDDRVLVVEGYFDVVRLVGAGIESVVAPMGTALTEAHAALLARYSKNAFLLYDSDVAGQKATFRSGDELLRHRVAVQVVTLPEGEDPDSFVDKRGAEALESMLASAIDVFERKIQILERAGWFSDLRRKRAAIDRLLPTVRATADPLLRDLYIGRAAEASGIAREVLERELGAGSRVTAEREQFDEPPQTQLAARMGDRRRSDDRKVRGLSAERALVRAMLHHRHTIEEVGEHVGPDSFRDPIYREIFRALLELGPEADVESVEREVNAAAAPVLQALLEEPGAVGDVRGTVDACLTRLRVRELEWRLEEIDRLLPVASPTEQDELTREKLGLVNEIKVVGAVGHRRFGKSRS